MKYTHTISADNVRTFCIHNQLYTDGSVEDYNNLLNGISHHKPDFTADEVYQIAKDIVEHSDDVSSNIALTYDNVAFYIANDVMYTYVDFDEE